MMKSTPWIALLGTLAGVAAAAWYLRGSSDARRRGIDPRVDRWDGEGAQDVDPNVAMAS